MLQIEEFKKEMLKCFLIEHSLIKAVEINLLIGALKTLQIEKKNWIKTIIIHLKTLLKH